MGLFLSHAASVSTVVSFPALHVGHPLGFDPEAALETLGLPPLRSRCGGGVAAWVVGVLAASGTQGSLSKVGN